jgi:hypothetical protein
MTETYNNHLVSAGDGVMAGGSTNTSQAESLHSGAAVVINALDLLRDRPIAVGLLGEYVLGLVKGREIEPIVHEWFRERLMKTLGAINEQLVAIDLEPVAYDEHLRT